jgi:hypothetical protein
VASHSVSTIATQEQRILARTACLILGLLEPIITSSLVGFTADVKAFVVARVIIEAMLGPYFLLRLHSSFQSISIKVMNQLHSKVTGADITCG